MEEKNNKIKEEVSVIPDESEIGYTHVLCCPSCSFFTLSTANLKQHALGHNRPTLSAYRTYTCSKCLSLSTERELMVEHISIYHRNTKNPVELTEEVHTIMRKVDPPESDSSHGNFDIGVKDQKLSRAKKNLGRRTLKKIKWRSRIKKFQEIRRRISSLRPLSQPSSALAFDLEEGCPDHEPQVEEGPIDMTVKTQQKPTGDPQLPPILDYSSLYSSLKCPHLDIFSKSPLTATLSNPMLMRYLTSQMHSLSANKYFGGEHFLHRNVLLPEGRLSSSDGPLFHGHNHGSHLKMSMSKLQCSDSESMETPHRSLHRNNFTPFQNHILLEWYDKHKNKPYPSTEDTKHLSDLCGLSYPQVKKWFANKRARSTFYQKNDMVSCDHDLRCDILRYPLRVTDRLTVDLARSMESQFRKSVDTKMPSDSDAMHSMQLH